MGRIVAFANYFTQVGGIVLAETHVERAGAGETDAIAALAEIMGHRRDAAHAAACLGHFDITGWATGLKGDVPQGELFLEIFAQYR
ncbi:hypothetical protein D3C73_1455820 [compost metagenome]